MWNLLALMQDVPPPEVKAEPLNAFGWILMIASLTFVVGLVAWCYSRVLRSPAEFPEPAKDFHSA